MLWRKRRRLWGEGGLTREEKGGIIKSFHYSHLQHLSLSFFLFSFFPSFFLSPSIACLISDPGVSIHSLKSLGNSVKLRGWRRPECSVTRIAPLSYATLSYTQLTTEHIPFWEAESCSAVLYPQRSSWYLQLVMVYLWHEGV
jgi:hypothetical protein